MPAFVPLWVTQSRGTLDQSRRLWRHAKRRSLDPGKRAERRTFTQAGPRDPKVRVCVLVLPVLHDVVRSSVPRQFPNI